MSSPPDDAYSLLVGPSPRIADLDLLRFDLCRVYRPRQPHLALFLHNAGVKSAFYELCGALEVGSANRKWSVSSVLAVFFLLCRKGLVRAGCSAE